MAASDRMTRLTAIRDNIEAEIADETSRRAALALAGHPAVTTYSLNGRSVSWNDWLAGRMQALKEINELIVTAGDQYEYSVIGY